MPEGTIQRRSDESVWKRLTRLFRSGPVVRHKIAAGETNNEPQGTAKAFKKEISSLYVHSLASYGQYERLARYADYSEMEFCITGETLIAVPGGFKTIKELSEECAAKRAKGEDDRFVVFSWDHQRNRLVATWAKHARLTRRDQAFTVTFDNGKKITGTSDHRLMLRDGSYRKICELRSGMAMMPFKRDNRFGADYVSIYDGVRWVHEHRMLGEFIAQRPLNDDEVVHHENSLKFDNRIENLAVMTRSEHATHHLREYNELKWDPNNQKWIDEFKRKHSVYMTESNPSARKDVTFSRILQHAEKNGFHLFRTMDELDIDYPTIVRRLQAQSFKNWETFAKAYDPDWKNHGQNNEGEKNPRWDRNLTYQDVCNAWTNGVSALSLAAKLKTTPAKIKGRVKEHGYKSAADFCSNYTNCKVVTVEPAGEFDLYDLTVDGYKNFATDSVVSHNTPEIASALDIYADEVTAKNENGEILQILSKNGEIKQLLETLFYDILNIEFNIWSWTRSLSKNGDLVMIVDASEENGILNLLPIPINEVEREEGFDKKDPFAVRFRWLTNGNMILENWQVIHFRLLGNDNFLPYGSSIIEPARRIWRQLILIEDAMLVYRIVRSPERRVFKIDVGNIPPDQVEPYIEKVKTQLKRQQVVDQNTGRVDLRYNPLSVDEDYFIPVRGDRSSDISTLAGGQFTGDIDDVQYIQNKLFGALKIPKAYLSYEGDGGSKATLAQQDVRFARTIDRIQKIIVSELNKIAIIHLFLLGYRGEELVDFDLRLANSSIIAEQQYLELWRTRLEIASAAQEGVFDREFIWKRIFKLSDAEIDRIRGGKKFDKIEDLEMEQVQLPGSPEIGGEGEAMPGEDQLPATLGGAPGEPEPPPDGGPGGPGEEQPPDDAGGPPQGGPQLASVSYPGPVVGEVDVTEKLGNRWYARHFKNTKKGHGPTDPFGTKMQSDILSPAENPLAHSMATPTSRRRGSVSPSAADFTSVIGRFVRNRSTENSFEKRGRVLSEQTEKFFDDMNDEVEELKRDEIEETKSQD